MIATFCLAAYLWLGWIVAAVCTLFPLTTIVADVYSARRRTRD